MNKKLQWLASRESIIRDRPNELLGIAVTISLSLAIRSADLSYSLIHYRVSS